MGDLQTAATTALISGVCGCGRCVIPAEPSVQPSPVPAPLCFFSSPRYRMALWLTPRARPLHSVVSSPFHISHVLTAARRCKRGGGVAGGEGCGRAIKSGPRAVPSKTSSAVFTAESFKLWFSYTLEGSGAQRPADNALSPSHATRASSVERSEETGEVPQWEESLFGNSVKR